jgi:cobalt/nickel transport system permease protein
VLSIDRYAYINKLSKTQPVEKLLFAAIPLSFCLVFEQMDLYAFVIVSMALSLVLVAGIPPKFYLKILLLPLPFVLGSIVAIGVNFSKVPGQLDFEIRLFSLFAGVTRTSLRSGLLLFARSYACVSCLYFISLTTPMVDIAWILKKMRVPAIFIEILMIIYRFIFELIDIAFLMQVSQESRLGYASLTKTYRSLGQLIGNLFGKAFQHYRALTMAMESRLYQGEFRVLESDYRLSHRNLCLLGGYFVIMICLVVL